ncbi:hypothetical protein NFI96_009166 [Prochilodus magdalenae]|nr:hypothetical protein NFI96_009166 [Prochilodus magdalenae]
MSCRSLGTVTYVGHIVSENGIATDPAKIEAVASWKKPTDLASLQSFLGFCGYYRRFIKNYSIIVRPLTELTNPPTQKVRKTSKSASEKSYFKATEPFGVRWDDSCTEASLHGLGAVLNQEYPERLRPVAFASHKLSSSEKNYPVHQLEFLALKWAVVDKFHDYLYGASFTVRTDNNPLTYVLTTAKLNATGHRWLAALSAYNFTIQYRPGCYNINADALSRNVFAKEVREWQDMSSDSIKALCKHINCGREGMPPKCAEFLGIPPAAIPDCYAFPTHLHLGGLELQSSRHLQDAQNSDPTITPVKKSILEGSALTSYPGETREIALLRREVPRLNIIDGLLYRLVKRPSGTEVRQLVLPKVYVPMMSIDIEQYVKSCGRCIARKALPQRAAPLNKMTSRGPLDLAFPTKDQKASTVAKVLFDFVHYGLPARIHSDQGRDFESKLIHELLRMLGIRKSRTTPYHPQGDPQPERFNRTLLFMLGTLDPRQKQRWSQKISQLVHAYNCTRNDATGYSPYLLMFGREARLPVDLCFGVVPEGEGDVSYQNYITQLRSDLQEAYKLAADAAGKNHERNKKMHDRLVKEQVLAKGDRVLLRNFNVMGKHKLRNKWRTMPYIVVGKMDNLPVYQVKPEGGGGDVKTVHRNHLLPIGCLVRMPVDTNSPSPPQRCVTRRQQRWRDVPPVSDGGLPKGEAGLTPDESEDSDFDTFQPVIIDGEQIWNDLQQCFDLPARNKEPRDADHYETPSVRCTEGMAEGRSHIEHPPEVNDAEAYLGLDSVSETPLEGGAVGESVKKNAREDWLIPRPRREEKPVLRLSYDELSHPSNHPLNTLSMGVLASETLNLTGKVHKYSSGKM